MESAFLKASLFYQNRSKQRISFFDISHLPLKKKTQNFLSISHCDESLKYSKTKPSPPCKKRHGLN